MQVSSTSSEISQKLFYTIVNQQGYVFNTFMGRINNKKASSAFLFTAYTYYVNRDFIKTKELIQYFQGNPEKIADIFLYGNNNPNVNFNKFQLLNFIENKKIIKILKNNRPHLQKAF